MKQTAADIRLRMAVIPAVFLVWEASIYWSGWNARLVPPPSQILLTLILDLRSGQLLTDVAASVGRATLGFLIGAGLGIGLGILTATQRWADALIGSIMQFVRPIPPIALVPLVVVWFGIGETGKVFLVTVGCLFPVWLNTHLGVQTILGAHTYLVQSLRPGYWSQLWNIWLPGAAGSISAGLRVSVAIAFYCLIAAEMTGAAYGLAYRIELAHLAYRVDRMIGHMMALGTLSFIADRGTRWLLKRVFPWLEQSVGWDSAR